MNYVENQAIKSISTNFGNDVYFAIKEKFKKVKYKNEADFISKVEDYIDFSINKIGYVKTLFYDVKPQNLFDFYESLNVQVQSRSYYDTFDEVEELSEQEIISTTSISKFMRNNNNVLFVGHGGCGKTMLLKYLFLNSLQEEFKIPIFVELRQYNSFNGDFVSFLYNTIKNLHFDISEEHFIYSLNSNKYLFLFDAFDEVYPEIAEELSSEIKDFSNLYSNNKFIITSRFSDGFVDWNNFHKFEVCGLSLAQSISLINKIKALDDVKEDFIRDLKSKLYQKYKSFASSPLLLNIMLITYESISTLPDKLNGFYEKAFQALFYSHDLSKNRYKRKTKTELGYEDFKRLFNRVCFMSYIKKDYMFNFNQLVELVEEAKKAENISQIRSEDYIEDLQTNLCMLVKDGFDYFFTHRSFQEYFAASFIQLKTDVQQIEIFRILYKTASIFNVENFWHIMYEMQKERFIENVLITNLITLVKSDDSVKEYMIDNFDKINLTFDDESGKEVLSYSHTEKNIYGITLDIFESVVKKDYDFLFKPEKSISSELIERNVKIRKRIVEELNLNEAGFFGTEIKNLIENDKIFNEWKQVGFGRMVSLKIEKYIVWEQYYIMKNHKGFNENDFLNSL